jgi:hypothetical protein
LSLSYKILQKTPYKLKSLKSVYSAYTPKTVVIGVTGGGGGQTPLHIFYLRKMLYWLLSWRRESKNFGESDGRDICILLTGSNHSFPSF